MTNKVASSYLTPTTEIIELFSAWLEKAQSNEINDANAMALATVDHTGMPNVRMVLLKEFNAQGFVFYTNYESAKGQELLQQKKAALCFHWKALRRQIRLNGVVTPVTAEEADAYFHSRPRMSQIGAWASKQSRALESRFALEKAVAHYTKLYALGEIPRPPYWSGFRLSPLRIEFWQDKAFRLHERILFQRATLQQDEWEKSFLYP